MSLAAGAHSASENAKSQGIGDGGKDDPKVGKGSGGGGKTGFSTSANPKEITPVDNDAVEAAAAIGAIAAAQSQAQEVENQATLSDRGRVAAEDLVGDMNKTLGGLFAQSAESNFNLDIERGQYGPGGIGTKIVELLTPMILRKEMNPNNLAQNADWGVNWPEFSPIPGTNLGGMLSESGVSPIGGVAQTVVEGIFGKGALGEASGGGSKMPGLESLISGNKQPANVPDGNRDGGENRFTKPSKASTAEGDKENVNNLFDNLPDFIRELLGIDIPGTGDSNGDGNQEDNKITPETIMDQLNQAVELQRQLQNFNMPQFVILPNPNNGNGGQ